MHEWLRVGRRLEWSIAAYIALSFFVFVFGFLFASRAPQEIRWFVWGYVGGFFLVFGFLALLVVQLLRRFGQLPAMPRSTSAHPSEMRFLLYLVTVVVMVPADRAFAKAAHVTLNQVLFWDAALLIVVITANEIAQWRKRRSLQ